MYRCKRCKQSSYCSSECQRADWDRHRLDCLEEDKKRVIKDIHQTRMMSPSSGFQMKN